MTTQEKIDAEGNTSQWRSRVDGSQVSAAIRVRPGPPVSDVQWDEARSVASAKLLFHDWPRILAAITWLAAIHAIVHHTYGGNPLLVTVGLQ